MLEEKPYAISPASWVLLAGITACALIGSVLAGFTFPIVHLLYLVIFAGGLGLFAFIVKMFNVKDGDLPYRFVQHIIILIPGAIFCQILLCIGAAQNFHLIDVTLIKFDHAMGFDWRLYAQWLAAHPTLAHWFDISYNLMVVEMGVVMCVLCMYRRFLDSERFVFSYLAALFITAFIASVWPSVGAYVFYDIDPTTIGLTPPAARIHEADLLALRAGELRYFPIIMKGLVTFPSFHTATALLLLLASWPIRWLRAPSLALNISMIVSTLACGGHYLADIWGGIAVAYAGYAISRYFLPEKAPL